ncbi:MAG: hypothetical protein FGM33_05420, partial [Candidatus Kapabacteria bacterium]|nr:hypothetical protein [Candidatus Kapabacteria bacterium]
MPAILSTLLRRPFVGPTIAILMVLSMSAPAAASSGGYTGRSIVGCGGCHGGASANTNVNLEGSRTVKAGSTNTFTFVVGHPQHRNAGFNLTFRDNVGSVGTLTAGPNTKVQGNELTH